MAVNGKNLRKKDVVAVDEVLRVLDSNDETALINLREKLHQSKNQVNLYIEIIFFIINLI